MRMIVTEAGGYVVPPCPSWCVLPADHDLANPVAREFNGSLNRAHSAGAWVSEGGDSSVEIVQTTVVGDPSERGEDMPCLYVRADEGLTTAAQARRLASALLAAAERLEAIGGSSE